MEYSSSSSSSMSLGKGVAVLGGEREEWCEFGEKDGSRGRSCLNSGDSGA